ncbi:MAG: agmatine deiminase family protein [Pseudomonadota bacterium]
MDGIRWPAEWEPQADVWTAWPSHPDLWGDGLEAARNEVAGLIKAIGSPRKCVQKAPKVNVLVADRRAMESARAAIPGGVVSFVEMRFGDIWLRDTAPVFVFENNHAVHGVRFRFNGWGGKYILPHDGDLGERLLHHLNMRSINLDMIGEGGAIEGNGAGTLMTTAQCLLNPNRRLPKTAAALTEEHAASALKSSLGVDRVIWLSEGLAYDHTDGHIDNCARFISPQDVVCMRATTTADPQATRLSRIEDELRGQNGMTVHTIPSPGRVVDEAGEILPASYLNFLISNGRVVMPVFGSEFDAPAKAALAALMPQFEVIDLPAKAILKGGGTFHCITQQQPALQS